MTWVDKLRYGRSPLDEPYPIPGTNDESYSDSSFVCVLQGRSYVPMSVSEALLLGTTKIVGTAGEVVDGYRVVKRNTATLVSEALVGYTAMCSVLAATIDEILKTCLALGYNVTSSGDILRIVDDLNSNTMHEIPKSLPILILPFWDNALVSRSVISGKDGNACMVQLDGSYVSSAYPIPLLKAANRTVREAKTIEFLKRPGGRWTNGWYEDLEGVKWYSDLLSSASSSSVQSSSDISLQQFSMLSEGAVSIKTEPAGASAIVSENWGSIISYTEDEVSMTSVVISNGERFGVFLY